MQGKSRSSSRGSDDLPGVVESGDLARVGTGTPRRCVLPPCRFLARVSPVPLPPKAAHRWAARRTRLHARGMSGGRLGPAPGGGGQLTVPRPRKRSGAEESPHSGNQGGGRKPAGREPEPRSRHDTAGGYEESEQPRRFLPEMLKRPSPPEQARRPGMSAVPRPARWARSRMLPEQNGAYDLDLAAPARNRRGVCPSKGVLAASPDGEPPANYYPTALEDAPRRAIRAPDDVLASLWDLGSRQSAKIVRSSTEQRPTHRQHPPPGDDPGDSLYFPGDEWGSSLGLL